MYIPSVKSSKTKENIGIITEREKSFHLNVVNIKECDLPGTQPLHKCLPKIAFYTENTSH